MNVMKNEERKSSLLQPREALDNQNASPEQPSLKVDRRQVLKRAGMVLGASGALAALAIPAGARSVDQDADEIAGLWQGVVSPQDKMSFPPFKTFELFGGGIWIASGQTDLTLGALDSALWGVFKRVGHSTFRGIGRFWTYDMNFNNTGFGTVEETITVSKDGKTYHAEGPSQFFDNNGNPIPMNMGGGPTTILDDGIRIAFP